VRKVNADDKRQAAELIELDGGELRREPLDTRKATFGVAAAAPHAILNCGEQDGGSCSPLFAHADIGWRSRHGRKCQERARVK
jgi:hypothetical protein